MNLPALPPTVDCPPEFCFCGRKTVEFHEFWFCSTECARQDSLRSLGGPDCHYRNVVRQTYVQASPELQLRRMKSVDNFRLGPSERRGFANAPSRFLPQSNTTVARRAAQDQNMAGFPTLSQVTGKVLTKKAKTGEALVLEIHDRPRWEGFPNAPSRGNPGQWSGDHSFEKSSPHTGPLSEHVPACSLRRVPTVGTLLAFGRSRKDKEGENPRILSHAMNPIIPPVRKESLPSHHQMSPPYAVPMQTSKALRRSVSLSGGSTIPHSGCSNEQASLMHMIEEMREEFSAESFDPRSLFDQEGPY
ncbi:hypothetical protein HD554DRAFT_2172239 [Boletus coccyginus]|nr:hypothetical protein HD554DRAFT_2172239 [Boletus coccyginus]